MNTKGIKNYIKGIMSDSDGSPSSKRLVTILATILLTTGFLANLFWGFTIDQFIFDAISYIVIAGLGISGAEKFAPKITKDKKEEED